MIRPLRWLCLVLPSGWIVALFMLFLLIEEVIWLWLAYTTGDTCALLQQRLAMVGSVCVGYAVFRIMAFHPLFRSEYRKWLESTPWSSPKPLPVGPVHLVVQDLVVLGILFALLHTWHMDVLDVLVVFAGAYQLAVAASLWPTGLRWRCYTILFVLGLVVRFNQNPLVALVVLVALYPFTRLAVRRCLERFPWQLPHWWPRFDLKPNGTQEQRKFGQSNLGWPYDLLRPIKPRLEITLADGTALSVLLGWWAYAIAANISNDGQQGTAVVAHAIVLGAALTRLMIYCQNYWWPISLWGRLWTGRWIIPRYDRVLVAPLLAVALHFVGMFALLTLRLEFSVWIAITLAVPIWILLNGRPKLFDWQLTGGHHIGISPTFSDKNLFAKL
jgi:hypothetical protein